MKERAGFTPRLLALLIDIFLLLAISLVVGLMIGSAISAMLLSYVHMSATPVDLDKAHLATGVIGIIVFIVVAIFVSSLLSLPYNLMEALWGWTPGKLATGLRVRNEDGGKPTLGQVFSRWLIKHNAILISLLTFIGLAPAALVAPFLQVVVFAGCFLALRTSRQALHDQMTGTAVYEVSELKAHAQAEENSVL